MTILAAGDIAIVGYLSETNIGTAGVPINDANRDTFAFVLLTDIDATTSIKFTDGEWVGNGIRFVSDFAPNGLDEGALEWVSGSAMTAGTVITIQVRGETTSGGVTTPRQISASEGTATWDADAAVFRSSFGLSTAGDHIIAYQGTASQDGSTMTPIAAFVSRPNGFVADGSANSDSEVPDGLTVGTSAVSVNNPVGPDEWDGAYYVGPTSATDAAQLSTFINTATNWTGTNDPQLPSVFPTSFTITGAAVPQEINVTGNGITIADGDTTPSLEDDTTFGATDVTGGSVTRTFTIANQGGDPLTISDVTITGANPGDFSVTTAPSGSVSGGGQHHIHCDFQPHSCGPARSGREHRQQRRRRRPLYLCDQRLWLSPHNRHLAERRRYRLCGL